MRTLSFEYSPTFLIHGSRQQVKYWRFTLRFGNFLLLFPSIYFRRKLTHGGIHSTFLLFLRQTCCAWHGKYSFGELVNFLFGKQSQGEIQSLPSIDIIRPSNTYIFMLKPRQNFNFPQCSLAIGLMFEWWYFLDGDFCFCYGVVSRSRMRERNQTN